MKKGLIFPVFIVVLCSCKPINEKTVTLLAGVGMSDVVEEIVKAYEEETGIDVIVSLANSAVLAWQLENGAEADVVIFASKCWADYSEDRKTVDAKSRKTVAGNRIVLVTPKTSRLVPLDINQECNLPDKFEGRLALGDPKAVPAGKYCMQSLEYFGWEESLQKRYLLTRDVRAALLYVALGEVEAGVVFASDATKSDKVKVLGTFPEESHNPITFISFKTIGCDKAGSNFYDYLQRQEILEVWGRHGFIVAKERSAGKN